MKSESAINLEQINKRIESNKKEFRRHQRELTFNEKCELLSLSERDKAICHAVLSPKTKNIDN